MPQHEHQPPQETGRARPLQDRLPIPSPPDVKITTIVRERTDTCDCGANPHPPATEDPSAHAAALREDLGWPPAPPRVRCEWCGAEPGERCVAPSRRRGTEIRRGRRIRRLADVIHPSRWEAAA